MDTILIALLVSSIFINLFLLLRQSRSGPTDDHYKIRAQYEEEIEIKRKKFYDDIEQERKKSFEEIQKQQSELLQTIQLQESSIAEQINLKKSQMVKDLETEIELRKEQNRQLKIELAKWIEEEKLSAQIQVDQIQEWIEDWRSKQNAVVESYKKLDELKNKDSHHRISLSDDEEVELIELNKAISKLKNPLPFRKAVYDIYYKPKINELVLRVIGQRKITGIYKITHIDSGRTYVGQSVDIGNRWKQHAKRGSGAEPLTANKLYPAMLEFGLEAFHFEVIEEIADNNKLNEAEKYWQDYFKAQEFGYSIK